MDIFGKSSNNQESNTIMIRTSAQFSRPIDREIKMDEETLGKEPSESDEQMTEEDIEEFHYFKKKITNIVEGKENQPLQYENVSRPRKDSLLATTNDLDFFGSPN